MALSMAQGTPLAIQQIGALGDPLALRGFFGRNSTTENARRTSPASPPVTWGKRF
jgi:hypothetical protein